MRELRQGLWHWQAPHPDWESSEPWDPNVSSYAIVDDERLLLFDPLGVPGEIEGACSRAGDGDRPDLPVARAGRTRSCGADRRAGVHAAT